MVNNMGQFYRADAEQSVIGGVMLNANSDRALTALEMLLPTDFYLRQHQQIWEAIRQLFTANRQVDIVTVADQLDRNGSDSDVRFSYLGEISKNTPSQANVHVYAKIVKDHSKLRNALAKLFDASEAIHDKSIEPADRINSALSMVSEIGSDDAQEELKDPAEVAMMVLDRMQAAFTSGSSIVGLSSGFENIDRMTGGFRDSDLIIVAARPSMGKSTFCLNIAENVALLSASPKPVLFVSLEMPAEQLMQKTISRAGNLMLTKVLNGQAIGNDYDLARVGSALEIVKRNSKFLRIDDRGGQHISQIQARAKRAAMKMGGLSLIVVDYLQMINAEGESQTIRIGNVSKGLKELAKALKCPVIALSQLNRALNGKPELKNLRDSGSIEQDADVVMFLHDEDYEGERTQDSLTEIIFAKQRMAAIGSTYLQPELGFSRFSDTNRLPAPKVEPEPKKYTSKRYDQ